MLCHTVSQKKISGHPPSLERWACQSHPKLLASRPCDKKSTQTCREAQTGEVKPNPKGPKGDAKRRHFGCKGLLGPKQIRSQTPYGGGLGPKRPPKRPVRGSKIGFRHSVTSGGPEWGKSWCSLTCFKLFGRICLGHFILRSSQDLPPQARFTIH